MSNFSGKPKAEFRQNQFGATIGGPVRLPFYNGHDKTFFFGDYEGLQIRQAATSSLLDLPPAAFRSRRFLHFAHENLRPRHPRPGAERRGAVGSVP